MTAQREWKPETEIEVGGIVVVINKLDVRYPRYSMCICRKVADKTSKFMQVEFNEEGDCVTFDKLEQAIAQAKEYIAGKLAEAEAEHVENTRRAVRGVRGLSGGPGSGKTARERAKKRASKDGPSNAEG